MNQWINQSINQSIKQASNRNQSINQINQIKQASKQESKKERKKESNQPTNQATNPPTKQASNQQNKRNQQRINHCHVRNEAQKLNNSNQYVWLFVFWLCWVGGWVGACLVDWLIENRESWICDMKRLMGLLGDQQYILKGILHIIHLTQFCTLFWNNGGSEKNH